MAQVRVTRTLNANSQFAKAALKKGHAKARERLQNIADDSVKRAEALVAAELINDRPASRRHAGTRKLKGSFRSELIDGGGRFTWTIRLYSRANAAKVNALEQGAGPHTITATTEKGLWLPAIPKGSRGNAALQAYTTSKRKVGMSVDHPGNKPYRFMHRALEGAASAALDRAIKLKRS